MKILLSMGILASLLTMIGCGGGADTGGTDSPNVPTPSVSGSNDLIIDNGRGTSNNQDTESAQD